MNYNYNQRRQPQESHLPNTLESLTKLESSNEQVKEKLRVVLDKNPGCQKLSKFFWTRNDRFQQQRTIPEMLSGQSSNTRPSQNNRFIDINSEQAMAPTSTMTGPRSTYINPHHDMYPMQQPPTYMEQPPFIFEPYQQMSHQKHSLDQQWSYPQANPTKQEYEPAFPAKPVANYSQPKEYFTIPTPHKQPYYGVPGFYSPKYGSYEEAPQNMDKDLMMVADPAPPPQHRHAFSRYQPPTATVTSVISPTQGLKRPASKSSSVGGKVGSSRTEQQSAPTPAKTPRFTMEAAVESNEPSNKLSRPDSPATHFQPKIEPSLHILTGSVQHVQKFEPMHNHFSILVEVIAPLKTIRDAGSHKELLMRDESGPVLQVLFYEIDRILPLFKPGQLVRAVGRLLSRSRLQAYSVRSASEQECSSLQRVAFVCKRATAETSASS